MISSSVTAAVSRFWIFWMIEGLWIYGLLTLFVVVDRGGLWWLA